MAGSTAISGLPYPSGTDPNNVPGDLQALAEFMDGSLIRRLTQAEIDALVTSQRPSGLVVYNLTRQRLQVSTGTGWQSVPQGVPRIAAGSVFPATATVAITFPASLFSAAPVVVATNSPITADGTEVIAVTSITTSGATLKAIPYSGGSWRANWVAVQP